MAKGISQFKAQTLANFASPTLYRVEITTSNPINTNSSIRERLSLVCHNASIPGLTLDLTDKDMAYRANVNKKSYEDVTLAFHCNDDMLELEYFQKWMSGMVNHETNRVGYYNDYIGNVTIYKLSRQPSKDSGTETNATTLITIMHDAFPKRIEPLSLDYSSASATMSLSVNFAYRYYTQEWISLPKNEPLTKPNPINQVINKSQNLKAVNKNESIEEFRNRLGLKVPPEARINQ